MRDDSTLQTIVERTWDESIVSEIASYIRIPAKSPAFDREWEAHGHLDEAVTQIERWCRSRDIAGLKTEIVRLPGRTPLLFIEIPASAGLTGAAAHDTVLLYGHYDKQPEFLPWGEGLGPWEPVQRGDKLYGRGGADDGYAAFASLLAIEALERAGGSHARAVVLIEGCEESGSFDLPAYLEHLADRIGTPSLVVCLDSGCGNYDQLWCTTSLRGLVTGVLRVRVLEEGVHSGDASGVVPSSFRILRRLLDRLEDPDTGAIRIEGLHATVPEERVAQARTSARVLGETTFARFPWAGTTRAVTPDPVDLVLQRTWQPFLAVVGVDGIPALGNAGNVLRPETAVKLSLRIPPTVAPKHAASLLAKELTRDPPHGAVVTFDGDQSAPGWNAPATAPWLEASLAAASKAFFGAEACAMGEGGTIPFMGMLGERYPEAQFVITGVLGPQSNAHGPNEFLHIPTGKKLTSCVARVLDDHVARHAATRE